jgi:drug/metabolite transporter (DMT)-like permease
MLIALTFLIIVGFSWTCTGIVMGGTSRHNVPYSLMQLIAYCFSTAVTVSLLFSGLYPPLSISRASFLQACWIYPVVGALNFLLLVIMAKGMERGPNSLVWAILQSGMVIPFIYGICFHGVKAGVLRLAGMVLLLVAVPLMALSRKGKDEPKKSNGRSWVVLALMAFAVCGIQQTLNSEPSYNEEIRTGFSAVHRCLLMYIANVVVAAFMLFLPSQASVRRNLRAHLKNRYLWIYAIGLQSLGLISGFFLLFNGMDRMAKLGMGAISYPIMVVSCIMGFTLFSLIWLRERLTWQAVAGLVSCMAGMVLICLQ